MCFEKLLGLKDCGLPDPTTRLFIDSLGITKTLLGSLITDQYESGTALFIDKREFAWKKLSSDILLRFGSNIKAESIIEGKRIGQPLTDYTNVDAALGAGIWAGIRVKINPNDTSFLNFYISSLLLNIGSPGVISVLIFDMNTGKKVKVLSLLDGSIEHFINETLQAKRRKLDLAIVYESIYPTFKTITRNNSILSCATCGDGYDHIDRFVDAQGINLTTDGQKVLSYAAQAYTQGMSLNYNVNCDRESWLCSIGSNLSMALAYSAAYEIYDYGINTSPQQRVNTTVSFTVDQLKEARVTAGQRYNLELEAIIGGMRIPDDVNCFECEKGFVYANNTA